MGMLLSAHLLAKTSQQEQMNYPLVCFSATRGTKQTQWTLQLSSHIFPRIDQLRNDG